MENNSITVFLHDTDQRVQSITVHPTDSLRLLDEYISMKGQRVLYCNGFILMPAFSFAYLNVKDNDHVFVVRPSQKKNLLQSHHNRFHQNIFRKREMMKRNLDSYSARDEAPERPEHAIAILKDQSIIHEASRIADLTIAQASDAEQLTLFYNLQRAEVQQEEEKMRRQQQRLEPTHIIYPNNNQTSSPSSEALPLLWGSTM